jgi:hypothetical protein
LIGADKIRIFFFLLRLYLVFKQEVLSLVFSRWRCRGNQIVKQKPGEGAGGGVEARDFTVSEGHGHPLVKINLKQRQSQNMSVWLSKMVLAHHFCIVC